MAARRTHTPWHSTSLRMPRKVHDLLFLAAQRADETRAEFVRTAIKERAERILTGPRPEPAPR
jgi:uncharacterized protein (DUF1778 family)